MATPGMLCCARCAVLQPDRQDLSCRRKLIFEMSVRVGSCPHSTCNWLLVLVCYLLRFRHASVAATLPACACELSLRVHFKVPGQCLFLDDLYDACKRHLWCSTSFLACLQRSQHAMIPDVESDIWELQNSCHWVASPPVFFLTIQGLLLHKQGPTGRAVSAGEPSEAVHGSSGQALLTCMSTIIHSCL